MIVTSPHSCLTTIQSDFGENLGTRSCHPKLVMPGIHKHGAMDVWIRAKLWHNYNAVERDSEEGLVKTKNN